MKKILLAVASALLLASTTAQAVEVEPYACLVDDPTGTPLNLRTSPEGRIIGALHNGALVTVTDVGLIKKTDPWAYVIPDQGNQGWVFRKSS